MPFLPAKMLLVGTRHVKAKCLTSVESVKIDKFDVRGSVNHGIIHIENPTRCNSIAKFYFIYIYIYIYI
jgi:hypothetical protein